VVLFWLLTDDSFRVSEASVTFEGLQHADEAAVRERLAGLDRAPNVFRVRASDIVAELSQLVEVDAASASVTLPASVSVRLDERDPVFVWSDGRAAWLVDEEGMLFAPLVSPAEIPSDDESPAPDDDTTISDELDVTAVADDAAVIAATARIGLPSVEDARNVAEPPTVGSHLPEGDFAVMRQLLAITPELLGSSATELEWRVDHNLGYTLTSDETWQAVFGHYTPNLQPPDVIPAQVQCLVAVLAAERKLERVRLVVSDNGCGTFTTHE
jgi:hypothetical protein